ncbi:MAG: hypothetical protein RBT78_09070 [Kiritimatiellia bacterium]|nr:hypothetical protein [Kiritimatiellia bacterium]
MSGFAALVLTLSAVPTTRAQSVTSSWNDAVSGSWGDASKWDKGLPLAGTNVFLGGSGSYTVDYSEPKDHAIGLLHITNTSASGVTRLNINTNIFSFNGARWSKAAVFLNDGATVTNRGGWSDGINQTLTINPACTWVQFGYVGPGNGSSTTITPTVNVNGGVFACSDRCSAVLKQTGGVATVMFNLTLMHGTSISGGVVSNFSTASAVDINRNCTAVLTNQGQIVTLNFVMTGIDSGDIMRVDGGRLDVTGDRFYIGSNPYSSSRYGTFIQSAGTVEMKSAAGLVIGAASGPLNANSLYQYQLSGGTLDLEKITFGAAANLGTNLNALKISGGSLNLGSGGLVKGAAPAATYLVQLSGGSLVAKSDWASDLNMTVTNTPGPGLVTFHAEDTDGAPHDVVLSGVMRGNGSLLKTGAGALLVNGTNTYTGATTVSHGTLGGTGSLAGTVTVAADAIVSAGTTNGVGTLSVTNLVLREGAICEWNYGLTRQDVVNVSGNITLPTHAVVNVSAAEGANPQHMPQKAVLFTYSSCDGAKVLDGWVVNGSSPQARVLLDATNKRVLLLTSENFSQTVYPDGSGRLIYVPDGRGNRVPDFSCAGYRGGGVPLPDVPVVKRLSPSGGDDTLAIQNAIKEVGANTPLDAQGFRGTVLLSRGVYRITNTLAIYYSGIVLRGEGPYGNGTVIFHQGTAQKNTLSIYGGIVSNVFKTAITDAFVPVGTKQITVASTDGLAAGQKIVVRCVHKQKWIDELCQTSFWSTNNFSLRWERTITQIDPQNKVLTLDAPITSQIDQGNLFAQGEVHLFHTHTRVSNIGIENLILMSDYDRSVKDPWGYFADEQHADIGIHFIHASDCWVRRVTGFFYYWCLVRARDVVTRITIEDCAMLDGVSTDTPNHHTGTRDYSFCLGGSQMLCQRCYGRYGRHTFIMAGPTSGNVVLDCYAEKEHLSCEPHQWWQSGSLYDNVRTDALFKLNRSEGDHGQRAANCMLWNITCLNYRGWEPDIFLDAPAGGLGNQWAIGIINLGEGLGIASPSPESTNSTAAHIESVGVFVEPRSIYLAQLSDRLGPDAVDSITIPAQHTSCQAVWDLLLEQYGAIPEFGDPADLSWLPRKPDTRRTVFSIR